MVRGKELLDEERGRIRDLREVGHFGKDIARRLIRSRTCVQAAFQLHHVKITAGRPILLTSRDLRCVVRKPAT